MLNIFQDKKLVKSMTQVHNLGKLLCRSKFALQCKNHEMKIYGRNCVSCPNLLKHSYINLNELNFAKGLL